MDSAIWSWAHINNSAAASLAARLGPSRPAHLRSEQVLGRVIQLICRHGTVAGSSSGDCWRRLRTLAVRAAGAGRRHQDELVDIAVRHLLRRRRRRLRRLVLVLLRRYDPYGSAPASLQMLCTSAHTAQAIPHSVTLDCLVVTLAGQPLEVSHRCFCTGNAADIQ